MESTGVPGRIHVSRSTYTRVHDLGFDWEERKVEVKGKGLLQSYLLNSEHHLDPLAPSKKVSLVELEEEASRNTIPLITSSTIVE